MAAVDRPKSGGTAVEQTDFKKETGLQVDENGDKVELEAADGELPSRLAPIEALGIPNWRELEKKLVRRLDMTLMPCLWVRQLPRAFRIFIHVGCRCMTTRDAND
jgi:hypothetical protein